jgi:hypothetical protein
LQLGIRGGHGRIEQHELLMWIHTRLDQVVEAVTERLTKDAPPSTSQLGEAPARHLLREPIDKRNLLWSERCTSDCRSPGHSIPSESVMNRL